MMDYQEAIEIMEEGLKIRECIPHLVVAYEVAISAMQEMQEYKQLGTLDEVREAMEKQRECKYCKYKTHSEIISELNSCNDCGLVNICEKRPEYGQYCRINCYDWRCRNER